MVLRPINKTEEEILSNVQVQQGLNWGVPRKGHPEGTVLLHVVEVLNNIEKISEVLTPQEYFDLRFIAFLHDTFKYIDQRNHSLVSKEFAKQYTHDPSVLLVIETHDDAYRIWKRKATHYDIEISLNELKARLGGALPLYCLFYLCDNLTGNKTQEPFIWLIEKWDLQLQDVCNKLILERMNNKYKR